MTKKKKCTVAVILFALVFGGILTVATFFDLQISQILTKNILEPNTEISNNAFCALFEIMGDFPVQILLSFSFSVLFMYAKRNIQKAKKNVLMVLWAVFSSISMYTLVMIWWNRIEEHILLSDNTFVLTKGIYLNLFFAFVGILFSVLGILAVNNLSDDNIKRLVKFSVATIIAVALPTALINLGIKGYVGRLRFRAMNVDPANELYGFSAFSRWYEVRGKQLTDETMMAVFGHTDVIKSFPSGHTSAAGTTYCLIMLGSVLDIKKKWIKNFLWIFPVAYTGMVALSRIMIGAHFLSDTLIGGTLSFVTMIIVREIVICRGENVKALFGKK